MYFGDHPVSERWGVHLEGQIRRTGVISGWQQFMVRPAVNYTLNDNFMVSGGYAFIRSHPYGDFPSGAVFPEHRTYQQLLAKHKAGPIPIQHRFRLEQRWIGLVRSPGEEVFDWQYRNRFRYMLRGDIPLRRDGKLYIGLYDEIFLNFGANSGPKALDQNRAYGALGYNFGRIGKLEVGYLHQYVPQRNGVIVEHNHTLQVAFYSTFPFRKQ